MTVPAERISLPTGPNMMYPASPEVGHAIVSQNGTMGYFTSRFHSPMLCTLGWFSLKSISSLAVKRPNIPRNTVKMMEGTSPELCAAAISLKLYEGMLLVQ